MSGKKKRDTEAEDKARLEARAAAALAEKEDRGKANEESQDLFGDRENEDVIF